MKKTCIQCAILLETISSGQKNMFRQKDFILFVYLKLKMKNDNSIQFGTKYHINLGIMLPWPTVLPIVSHFGFSDVDSERDDFLAVLFVW